MVRTAVPVCAVKRRGGKCDNVVSVSSSTGDEYEYEPLVPVRDRSWQLYGVLTERLLTVLVVTVASVVAVQLSVGGLTVPQRYW